MKESFGVPKDNVGVLPERAFWGRASRPSGVSCSARPGFKSFPGVGTPPHSGRGVKKEGPAGRLLRGRHRTLPLPAEDERWSRSVDDAGLRGERFGCRPLRHHPKHPAISTGVWTFCKFLSSHRINRGIQPSLRLAAGDRGVRASGNASPHSCPLVEGWPHRTNIRLQAEKQHCPATSATAWSAQSKPLSWPLATPSFTQGNGRALGIRRSAIPNFGIRRRPGARAAKPRRAELLAGRHDRSLFRGADVRRVSMKLTGCRGSRPRALFPYFRFATRPMCVTSARSGPRKTPTSRFPRNFEITAPRPLLWI